MGFPPQNRIWRFPNISIKMALEGFFPYKTVCRMSFLLTPVVSAKSNELSGSSRKCVYDSNRQDFSGLCGGISTEAFET
jgi:hypothetical protein